MTEQHHDSKVLIPVKINGWTLFEDGEDGHWVRDLDLAERAGLAKPHRIRDTIARAIVDGAIIPLGERNDDSPVFRKVRTLVTLGKGARREVDEFYLNESAALLLIMRLRTATAVEVTKAVVRVFLAAMRGEVLGSALMRRLGDLEARADLDRQEVLLLRSKLELVDPMSTGLIGEARANLLRGMLREAARIYCSTTGMGRPSSETRERDNELRMHVHYPHGIEQRWEHLPLVDFGNAMAKAYEILGRERKRQRTVEELSLARMGQLPLTPKAPTAA